MEALGEGGLDFRIEVRLFWGEKDEEARVS